ncbi:hypothetical protein BJX61DRAFT_515715 [Aspergillus egyptiacus]|nr:hypothetical protein BJX61DRAFT_515715 [Aspergillus egyptiacus]
MACPPGSSTWNLSEPWYEDNHLDALTQLLESTVGPLTTSDPFFIDPLVLGEPLQPPVDSVGGPCMELNPTSGAQALAGPQSHMNGTLTLRPQPRTLVPGPTESAPANQPSLIHGNNAPPSIDLVPRGVSHNILPAIGSEPRARPRGRRSNRHTSTSPETHNHRFQCAWAGCTYNGTFGRKAELMRHLDNYHIDPRCHKCPSCGRVFKRKDNLREHRLRIHSLDSGRHY